MGDRHWDETVDLKEELKKAPEGNCYLVAIAVSDYADATRNLANPVFDAEMIVELLLKNYGGRKSQSGKILGFCADNVKWFRNEEVNKDKVLLYFKELAARLQPEDSLLVYYAGHGEIETDTLYLSTYEYAKDKPSQRLTCQELAIYFNQIKDEPRKGRDVLFILDCCFSGGAKYGMTTETSGEFSRKLLVSASPEQKASDGQAFLGSPFARALGEALEEESRILFSIENMLPAIQKKVDILTQEKQEVSFGNIGQIPTGDTQFLFFRKETTLNPIVLTRNIIKHELNFKSQSHDFYRKYQPNLGKGAFTVFISPGKTMGSREILSYIFLCHKFDEGKYQVPARGYTYRSFELLNPDESVWQHLFSDQSMEKPADYFSHLIESFQAYFSDVRYKNSCKIELYNLVLNNCASPALLRKAAEFCADFYDNYKSAIEQLQDKKLVECIQSQVKTIFNIQEQREGPTTFVQKEWFSPLFNFEVNIVYELLPVEVIFEGEVRKWLEKTQPEIKHPDFKNLTPEIFFKNTNSKDVDELICSLYNECNIILVDKGDPINCFFSIKNPPGVWQL